MPLKLLAVGDIHLGRRPTRLPDELLRDAAALSPAAAWRRLVDRAIAETVDVVALAGDVVEREDDFFEAYRELKQGVDRLVAAGISVLGVAGNHDVQVLPQLADQLDGFQLLGRGGQWQQWSHPAQGETLTLHGWSFRQARETVSPLDSFPRQRGDGVNLGLLHCDRDQSGSYHAPVTSAALNAAGMDGWLLGHIHAPDALSCSQLSGYLGCVSGMDPGEPGDHGPWLISIEHNRVSEVSQWVLAPLRWERISLDISALTDPDQARDILLNQLREYDQQLANVTQPPDAVAIRLTLTGRSELGADTEALFKKERDSIRVDGEATGAHYYIERVLSDTRPTIPLQQLAQRSDPPGLLARRLLSLDQPETDMARRLIAQGRERLGTVSGESRWQSLAPPLLHDDEVIDWLRRAGTRMLDALLAQKETAE